MDLLGVATDIFAIIGSVVAVISLVIQVQKSGQVAELGAGSTVSVTQLIYVHPTSHPEGVGREPDHPKNSDSDSSIDDLAIWGLVLAALTAALLMYLEHRTWVLLAVAILTLLCFLANLHTMLRIKRALSVERPVIVAWSFILLTFALAFGLLIYLTYRSTPSGTYSEVTQRMNTEGIRVLLDSNLLYYLVFELFALAYILVISVMLTLRQVGTLSLLLALVSNSRPRWLARFGPHRPSGVWGLPLIYLMAMVLAGLFSSPWMLDFMEAINPFSG